MTFSKYFEQVKYIRMFKYFQQFLTIGQKRITEQIQIYRVPSDTGRIPAWYRPGTSRILAGYRPAGSGSAGPGWAGPGRAGRVRVGVRAG